MAEYITLHRSEARHTTCYVALMAEPRILHRQIDRKPLFIFRHKVLLTNRDHGGRGKARTLLKQL